MASRVSTSVSATFEVPDKVFGNGRHGTARYRERYTAILQITIDHLRKKGYQRTKVQQIADDSGVALATIYRYFSSRDKLIYIASEHWLRQIASRSLSTRKTTVEEHVIQLIRNAAKLLRTEPQLLEAWARVHLSNDPGVIELVRKREPPDWVGTLPVDDNRDPTLRKDLDLILDHVWFSGVTRWALGEKNYAQVYRDSERAAVLVLNAHQHMKMVKEDRSSHSRPTRKSSGQTSAD
jgi:AcrR family transcriptional regulator